MTFQTKHFSFEKITKIIIINLKFFIKSKYHFINEKNAKKCQGKKSGVNIPWLISL